ncbi:superoxide-generating NADPH oxidase heavy chain subunit A-like isoform X2 [Convolutriloba macropyga]|uniref:superoxide-generating NADPH oxidase heavy chain subunit A-like isoform X2 n=1 Tax=Convolutriloba macropyga TaxID=536237 RepID=UPI003F526267
MAVHAIVNDAFSPDNYMSHNEQSDIRSTRSSKPMSSDGRGRTPDSMMDVRKSVNGTVFAPRGNTSTNGQLSSNHLSHRKNAKGSWAPYEDMGTELPFTSLVQPPKLFYKIRWNILRLFHARLFNLWDYGVTLGEFILIPGIILAFTLGLALGCCDSGTTGDIASWAIFFTFVFSSKNSLITFLTGISYERLLFLHKLFALISVVTSLVHGLTAEYNHDSAGTDEPDDNNDETYTVVSGWVCFGLMTAAVVFAAYLFRKHFYEAFFRTHVLLALLVYVAAIIHNAPIAFLGAVFWFADIFCRLIVLGFNQRHCRRCMVKRLPCDVIQIKFEKNKFKYKSGQFVSIMVPEVTPFEWHLFSLSSAPHEDFVTIHIRVLGNWTKKFHGVLSQSGDNDIKVFINGPYGMPTLHYQHDYRLFMMISGGIGVTPLQSITSDLLSNARDGRIIDKIMFIWSVRDVHMITSVLDFDQQYFQQQLPKTLPTSFQPDLLETSRHDASSTLECHYHVTEYRSRGRFEQGNIYTNIQKDLRLGRPHLSQYFERMYEIALKNGESKVAVLCCGPSQMIAEALMLSSSWSKDGISFAFYPELFEL